MVKEINKITIISGDENQIVGPVGIIEGVDQNIWFTSKGNNKICRLNRNDMQITCYSNEALNAPVNIYSGGDGNMWVTCADSNGIARITPDFEYNKTPCRIFRTEDTLEPLAIKSDANGLIWISLRASNAIASIDPFVRDPQKSIKIYQHPYISKPSAIYITKSNELFFMNVQDGRVGVGRLNCDALDVLKSLKFHYILDGKVTLRGWAQDQHFNLWFSTFSNQIITFTPRDFLKDFSLKIFDNSHVLNKPDGMCLGGDGHIWFTNSGANQIGRFNPEDKNIFDKMTFYTHDQMKAPFDIKPDSFGAVWFTNRGSNNIGYISCGKFV